MRWDHGDEEAAEEKGGEHDARLAHYRAAWQWAAVVVSLLLESITLHYTLSACGFVPP